ncbi:hypothetical protein TELCIR_18659 [Teladorsagia circumcincta]|uniref:Uncharacterized protein n=1 Tax=Teladorsagia circumcincta TaxID=45464 RepID=A0A2G9TPE6_TELCI|nr:hypothetical protein TELCIR_18659 [Teladorsagia circumcincta]
MADSKLLLILAGLLFVDILVLTLWAVISPFRMSVMELPQLHFDDRVVIPEIEKCESNHSAVFQAVLYATKGILMIIELVRNPDGNNPRGYRRGMMKSVVTHGSTSTTLNSQSM